MRILIAAAIRRSTSSGMGKWTLEVSHALRTLGHEVATMYDDDLGRWCADPRLAVLTGAGAALVRTWHARGRWDVAVLHEPIGWLPAAFGRGPRSPAVVTMCHNVERHVFEQRRHAAREGLADVPRASRVKTPLFRLWQTDLSIRLADHVVCLSSADREYVIHRLGRAPESVSLVPNGVRSTDYALVTPRRAGRRVLFVGGWLDVKGARVLTRAWPLVRAAVPEASLTVAGAGVSRERVLACFPEAARPGISVTTAVDPEGMRRLYNEHDLLVMPSISEGSPLTLLEAAAAGLPIVASRAGGIPDLLRDERDALLYDPLRPDLAAAHVVRLLGSPALREALAASARRTAAGWTWTRTAEGLASACRRAVAARRARAAVNAHQPA